ncbi:MAG TPA: FTR1 family protein [Acidimicrobiales bacterium]|nr:FTR1 family protein [Acidimicrobiales bacterium]
MEAALLIMVREGFEAALVVAIIFAYLRKLERLDLSRAVWGGVAIAVAVSFTIGVVVRATIGGLEGDARLRAFAAISALACAVLTWMIFWMRRQSRLIKGDLEHKVDAALASERIGFALAGVALVAVLREGIEAALFLLAAGAEESGASVIAGALIGLTIASALAYLVYWGGRKMPMKQFFTVTGLVLIVFAAGLVARTVLFLQMSGDLGSFDLNGVYDLTSIHALTQGSEFGKFLAAMFGWDPRPSVEQVVAWLAYLVPVSILFLRPHRTPAPPTRKPEPIPVSS